MVLTSAHHCCQAVAALSNAMKLNALFVGNCA